MEKREEIRDQIEYEHICNSLNREQIDEFVEIMLEVALTKSPTIKIGRDAEYPTAFVQQRFAKITCSHIEKCWTVSTKTPPASGTPRHI